jgi:hypothetical protein
MMRHWNTIAAALQKGEVYVPILLQDENGMAHGNDWARGFMRGVLWSKSTLLARSHRPQNLTSQSHLRDASRLRV